MSTQHTPTPWRTTNDHANKICDQVGKKIAVCPTHAGGGQWRDREEADANAAFIVRACNAHEELVAAADEALNTLIGCCIPAGGCDDRKAILDTQKRLRDVLKTVGITYVDEVPS